MRNLITKNAILFVLNFLMGVTSYADIGPTKQLILNDGTILDRFDPTPEGCGKLRELTERNRADSESTLFMNLVYQIYFPGEEKIPSGFKVDELSEEQKIFIIRNFASRSRLITIKKNRNVVIREKKDLGNDSDQHKEAYFRVAERTLYSACSEQNLAVKDTTKRVESAKWIFGLTRDQTAGTQALREFEPLVVVIPYANFEKRLVVFRVWHNLFLKVNECNLDLYNFHPEKFIVYSSLLFATNGPVDPKNFASQELLTRIYVEQTERKTRCEIKRDQQMINNAQKRPTTRQKIIRLPNGSLLVIN